VHVGADLVGDPLPDLESQVGRVNGRVVGVFVLRCGEARIPLLQLLVVEDEVRHEGIALVAEICSNPKVIELATDGVDGSMPRHRGSS